MNKLPTIDLFKKIIEQEDVSLDFGFYWENIGQILDQIRSECDEIQEAWDGVDSNHLKEEIGDLINASISLAIFCKVDPFQALEENIEKYQKRFDCLVSLVQNEGMENLKKQPMNILMSFWKRAKILTEKPKK